MAYIEDYMRPHAFAAIKGAGLLALCRRRMPPAGPCLATGPSAAPGPPPSGWRPTGPASPRTLVEVVLLEAGRPDRHHFSYQDLSAMGAVGRSQDMRIRQIGSLALSLCYVAAGIADILVAAVRSRSVDIAAGLLILEEAGGARSHLRGR